MPPCLCFRFDAHYNKVGEASFFEQQVCLNMHLENAWWPKRCLSPNLNPLSV